MIAPAVADPIRTGTSPIRTHLADRAPCEAILDIRDAMAKDPADPQMAATQIGTPSGQTIEAPTAPAMVEEASLMRRISQAKRRTLPRVRSIAKAAPAKSATNRHTPTPSTPRSAAN